MAKDKVARVDTDQSKDTNFKGIRGFVEERNNN